MTSAEFGEQYAIYCMAPWAPLPAPAPEQQEIPPEDFIKALQK